MQEQPEWSMEQLDPEVFRRVWERVMEGRTDSPIQVAPSQEAVPGQGKTQGEEQGEPQQSPQEQPSQEQENGEGTRNQQILKQLLALAWEGAAAGGQLVRRTGGRYRMLAQLTADHRTALRRLSAAYFLETGEHCTLPPGRGQEGKSGPLDRVLREQYLWEEGWQKTCRTAAETLEGEALRELCQELAQDAALHTRAIRSVLERM